MKIMICSVKDAVRQVKIEPNKWHVVSLRTPHSEAFRIMDDVAELCEGMVVREFDDVWVPERGKVMPSKADMDAVFEFVNREAPDNLIVHCHAGVSRSSAMAYAIACRDKPPEEAVKMLNPMLHMPNEWMVDMAATIMDNFEIYAEYEKAFDGDPFASMIGE
jgi:predicted protein tyrosine phosphatase